MSVETRGLVLVAEDEKPIADLIGMYLRREGFGVHTVATGPDALAAARRLHPVAVILDVGLPGIDGTEVCRALRAEGDSVPILFCTARDDEIDRVLGLEMGGDDYITKPFSPRELTARVRALLRRARSEDEPQADVLERAGGRLVVDSARRRVTLDEAVVDLTESEFRLLQTLARFPGRVYTRSELVERLQGMEFEPYERTIDAHIKNLRRKLGDDARSPRLVLTVYGRGYAFAEEPG
jgi:DNA-binding response OmpR family regulator